MLRRLLSCALLSAMLWGCQKTNPHPLDPFEGINREIYGLNKTIDKAVIRPVAYVYWKYLPLPFQAGIGNFFDNLREIPNVANDILQGKIAYATHDAGRFLINSTLGIGGFFDVAGNLGMPHRREDFGQTLYTWGWCESAYLVLPILGPSTIRDTVGIAVDYYAFSVWPWIEDDEWRYGLLALDLIDLRARLLRHDTVLSTVAVDEYAFIRDAYFQRRLYLINNELDKDENDDPYDAASASDNKLLAPEVKSEPKPEEAAKETEKTQEKKTDALSKSEENKTETSAKKAQEKKVETAQKKVETKEAQAKTVEIKTDAVASQVPEIKPGKEATKTAIANESAKTTNVVLPSAPPSFDEKSK
ncbi:MlaA family lipoprotein [Candidatus Berkiella aquae]|uniref:Putative phospholipid-binding lipoprotein MlaA n=1 Tax=Candidatus Berkiella aquae TaxID=295108 RepID=A0A0Q9Z214_9GAMM|nr:VacJ family lipoprotein [Candidatus Berkiella aquae]MCS5712104.1 VacJ family lipoprotein [Candidatus Berkiella aquae]